MPFCTNPAGDVGSVSHNHEPVGQEAHASHHELAADHGKQNDAPTQGYDDCPACQLDCDSIPATFDLSVSANGPGDIFWDVLVNSSLFDADQPQRPPRALLL